MCTYFRRLDFARGDIGCQHMDQPSPAYHLRSPQHLDQGGGVSDHDARLLAPDMRLSADFIDAARRSAKATEFACYVRFA